ncbi:MAG: translation factor GTPase family protein [Streptosporangiaceae bacterium]
MPALNLGILAHVDAGKTSLTERLLYAAGVIDTLGRVDDGSTQTDTLTLERQRGITIKAAVVSFRVRDRVVNLIDTPGHPDFIAEVERAIGVLDGAVLVVSAVEGVQPQTRILARVLRRLGIPTLIFVNKIDRSGARYDAVLAELGRQLTPAVVPMGTVNRLGSPEAAWLPSGATDAAFGARLADVLTSHDDTLLGAYVAAGVLPYGRLRAELAVQTGRALVHPVFFGSAVTGAGVDSLTAALTELLPAASGADCGPGTGTVFKVERGSAGEKVAYVRMFTGTLTARSPVQYGSGQTAKVTAISVLDGGPATPSGTARAGQIAKVWGLAAVGVGDRVGPAADLAPGRYFPPPTLETVVTPLQVRDRAALHVALTQLAEQDPLISMRLDDARHATTLALYGEVQQEVIAATLAGDYGIDVRMTEPTTICVERVVRTGQAAEFMDTGGNPFRATLGLRVQPGPAGSGVQFTLEIELGALPLAFIRAVEETVRATLGEGLRGWRVIDCAVTLTHSGFTPPPPTGWSVFSTSASDFRNLTPLVLMTALRRAATVVCEPVSSVRLEIPEPCLRAVLTALARLGAAEQAPTRGAAGYVVRCELAADRVRALRQQLPGLTGGDGLLEADFARYRPARDPVPTRDRTDRNPLDRSEYLLRVRRAGLP